MQREGNNYLGVNIYYSNNNYVKFTIHDFIEDMLKEGRDNMNELLSCTADNKLLNVDCALSCLSGKDMDYVHRMTACLLFAYQQARQDMQVVVALMCTWVKDPTEEDYNKLTRVIKYLQSTIHLPLLIGWDETGLLTWNVDTAFAVHAKSSTEANLVGVDDAMKFVVCRIFFFGLANTTS